MIIRMITTNIKANKFYKGLVHELHELTLIV